MPRRGIVSAAASVALAASCGHALQAPPPARRVEAGGLASPLMGMDASRLVRARQEQPPSAAVRRLLKDANGLLTAVPLTIVGKRGVPPSGSKNDFMTVGIYLWPDPGTPDGLPYVYRDGQRNPELAAEYPDWENFTETNWRISTLALAHFVSGNAAHATKAIELLRVWYLSPATRMQPHLRYAHSWPGKHEGEASGIICLEGFGQVLDAVTLLRAFDGWQPSDDAAFAAWVTGLLNWLQESEFGKIERSSGSNHGTHYSATVASMLFFLGRTQEARRAVLEGRARMALQIEPDGSQPRELRRSTSLHYSIYNITGLVWLARLGDLLDIEFWRFETPDHRSLKKAIDFVARPAVGASRWPHSQITAYDPVKRFLPILKQAATALGDPSYEQLIRMMPAERVAGHRASLIYDVRR